MIYIYIHIVTCNIVLYDAVLGVDDQSHFAKHGFLTGAFEFSS